MKAFKAIIIFFAWAILFSSCEDFLSEEPRHAKTQEDMWSTTQDITASVGGLYYLIRDALEGNARGYGWGDYFLYGDVASGDWISPNGDGDWTAMSKGQFRGIGQEAYSWKRFYRTIEQANLILDNVDQVGSAPQDMIDEAKGHAYFARAFSYLYLVRMFSDVPLNLKSQNIEPLGRNPRLEVLLQAEKDLKAAKNLLPVSYLNEQGAYDKFKTRCMATKGACDGILARAYMWLAHYVEKGEAGDASAGQTVKSAEEYYQATINAVQAIEDQSIYQLLPATAYRDIFDKGYTNESIFELYYSDDEYPRRGDWSGEGDATNYYGSAMTWWLPYPYTDRTVINITMKMDRLFELYSAQDKRTEEFFQGLLNFEQRGSSYTFVSPLTLNQATQQGNLVFAKYRKRFDQTYNFPNNVIISRLGWLYLFKAEAHLKRNELDLALNNLNIVRGRAGLLALEGISDKQVLFDEIRDEFRREAVGECVVYYFLVRNEIVSTMNPGISALDEQQGRTYWPISEDAFLNNQNMTQNPGW